MINAPLSMASPSVRNTVGYVGLLTLFNASVLILGHGASAMRSPSDGHSESHAAAEAHGSATEGEHGKPQAKDDHKADAKKADAKKPEAKKPEAKKPEAKSDAKADAKKPEAKSEKKAEAKKPEAKSDKGKSGGGGH
jgi:hypothetical protein